MNPNLTPGETKARVTEMLKDLSAFYRGEVTAEQYRKYAPKLSDIPLDILQEALDRCSDELKFFPLVPEIKERVASIRMERARAHRENDWERLNAAEVCPKCNNTSTRLIRDEKGVIIGGAFCSHE